MVGVLTVEPPLVRLRRLAVSVPVDRVFSICSNSFSLCCSFRCSRVESSTPRPMEPSCMAGVMSLLEALLRAEPEPDTN
jgi:hypothetical protein